MRPRYTSRMRFLILSLLLLSACDAGPRTFGAGASAGSPPPLPAGWEVPQFDHYCAYIEGGAGPSELGHLLDEASKEGWELVAVWQGLFCFKRPLDLDPSSPSLALPPPPAA